MKFILKSKHTLFPILIFLNIQYVYSQNRNTFFSDVDFASVDIVLLGEQTHGDGATFDEKVKLIKYLHQHLGFKIVAFESGLYDVYKAYELYSSGKEPISVYKKGIYSIWSETKAFKELLDYVLAHKEMKILGFDSQGSTLFKNYFIQDLRIMMRDRNIKVSEKNLEKIEKLLVINDFEEYLYQSEEFNKVTQELLKILGFLDAIENKRIKEKVIVQSYKSAINDLKSLYAAQLDEKLPVQNERDLQMANNFFFLKNLYPNEKFILWGANYHFGNEVFNFKYTEQTEDYIRKIYVQEKKIIGHNQVSLKEQINEIKELQLAKPMGYFLKKKYQNTLYCIAFTSFQGNYLGLHDKIIPIVLPPENSIEKKLNENNGTTSYVDLDNFNNEELYSSNLGYLPILANWSNVYDGICFVPEMYPPKKNDYSEENSLSEDPVDDIKTFKGFVLDVETKKPIPYADIYFNVSNRSSVSDENGFFSISVGDQIKNKGVISFSGIGYITSSINFDSIKSLEKIYLKKDKITELDQVVILSKRKLTATKIMKEAKKRIRDNYVQNPYNQIFKYKVEGFDKDNNPSFYEEALIDTYNSKGLYGSNTVENNIFAEILKLSYLPDKYSKEKWRGVGDLWITLNKDIILSKSNVLYRTSSYDLKLIGSKIYNKKKVYEIQFVNNKPGAYSTGYGYPAPKNSSGLIYIDSESYAIVKYEHCIVREKYKPKRANYTVSSTHKITQTYKEINGKYFINLFQIANSFERCYEGGNSTCKSFFNTKTLVSNDISYNDTKPIKRPLMNMKRGFNLKQQRAKSVNIKDLDLKFKGFTNCN